MRQQRQTPLPSTRRPHRGLIVPVTVLCILLTAGSATATATPGQFALQDAARGECGPIEAQSAFADRATTGSDAQSNLQLEKYMSTLSDTVGVLQVDLLDGELAVYVARDADVDLQALEALRPGAADMALALHPSCVSSADIVVAKANAAKARLHGDEFITVGYSQQIDRILVTTTLDQQTVFDLLGVDPDLISVATIEPSPDGGRLSRTADVTPHYGGAQIHNSDSYCSSGFSVTGSGEDFSITAGHCGSGYFYSGPYTFSAFVYRPNYPTVDIERLGDLTYDNRTYAANDNTTTKAVTNSGNPGNGYTYCNLGYVSRRVCFTQTSSGQEFCDAAGCTDYISVSSTVGSKGQHGDSGGPIAIEIGSNVGARGSVVAQEGPFYGGYYNFYYHIMSTIQSTLGVTTQTS